MILKNIFFSVNVYHRYVKHTQNVAKVPYEVDYQELLEKLEAKLQDLNYKTEIKGFVIRGYVDITNSTETNSNCLFVVVVSIQSMA